MSNCGYCKTGISLIQRYLGERVNPAPCERIPPLHDIQGAIKSDTVRKAVHAIGYWFLEFTSARLDTLTTVDRVARASMSGYHDVSSLADNERFLLSCVGFKPLMCENQLRGILLLALSQISMADREDSVSADVATFIEHLAGMISNPEGYASALEHS